MIPKLLVSKMIGNQNDSKMIGFQNNRNGKTTAKNRDESDETQSEYYDSSKWSRRQKELIRTYDIL